MRNRNNVIVNRLEVLQLGKRYPCRLAVRLAVCLAVRYADRLALRLAVRLADRLLLVAKPLTGFIL